jgi:osmotically-inducible protein OsmY
MIWRARNGIGTRKKPLRRAACSGNLLAARRLCSNGYSALKNVSCTFEEGWLILRGSVPSYYVKQLAQQAVARLEGVCWIDNQIEVVMPCLDCEEQCIGAAEMKEDRRC